MMSKEQNVLKHTHTHIQMELLKLALSEVLKGPAPKSLALATVSLTESGKALIATIFYPFSQFC